MAHIFRIQKAAEVWIKKWPTQSLLFLPSSAQSAHEAQLCGVVLVLVCSPRWINGDGMFLHWVCDIIHLRNHWLQRRILEIILHFTWHRPLLHRDNLLHITRCYGRHQIHIRTTMVCCRDGSMDRRQPEKRLYKVDHLKRDLPRAKDEIRSPTMQLSDLEEFKKPWLKRKSFCNSWK